MVGHEIIILKRSKTTCVISYVESSLQRESEAYRTWRNHVGTPLYGNWRTLEQEIKKERGKHEQSTLHAGKEGHNELCFILQWINEKRNKTNETRYISNVLGQRWGLQASRRWWRDSNSLNPGSHLCFEALRLLNHWLYLLHHLKQP